MTVATVCALVGVVSCGTALAVLAPSSAESPIVLRTGPGFEEAENQGFATVKHAAGGTMMELDLAGIPGAAITYGDLLIVANRGDTAKRVTLGLDATESELNWSFQVGEGDWQAADAEYVLDLPAQQSATVSLTLQWPDGAAPTPITIYVTG